ncbi:hypothetical protein JYU14_05330, partial [Simkania negevensis]|nr:hypothetical protein [Simkania negevensis]
MDFNALAALGAALGEDALRRLDQAPAAPAATSSSEPFANFEEMITYAPHIRLDEDRLKKFCEFRDLLFLDGSWSGYNSRFNDVLSFFSHCLAYGPCAESLRRDAISPDLYAQSDVQALVVFEQPAKEARDGFVSLLCRRFEIANDVGSLALDYFLTDLKKEYPCEYTQTAVLAISSYLIYSLEPWPENIAVAFSFVRKLFTVEERLFAVDRKRYCCAKDIPQNSSSTYVHFRLNFDGRTLAIDLFPKLPPNLLTADFVAVDFLPDSHSSFVLDFSNQKIPLPAVVNLSAFSSQVYQPLGKNKVAVFPGANYFRTLFVDDPKKHFFLFAKWISALGAGSVPHTPSEMTSHLFFEIFIGYQYTLLKEKDLALEDFVIRSFAPLVPSEKRKEFFWNFLSLWVWQTNGSGLTAAQHKQLVETVPTDLKLPLPRSRQTSQDAFVEDSFEAIKDGRVGKALLYEVFGVSRTSDLPLTESFLGKKLTRQMPGADDDDKTPPPRPPRRGMLQTKHSECMQQHAKEPQSIALISFLNNTSITGMRSEFFLDFICHDPEGDGEKLFDSLLLFNVQPSDERQASSQDSFFHTSFVELALNNKSKFAPEQKRKVLTFWSVLLGRNFSLSSYDESLPEIKNFLSRDSLTLRFMSETLSSLFQNKGASIDGENQQVISNLIKKWQHFWSPVKSGKSPDEVIISSAISKLFSTSRGEPTEASVQSKAASSQGFTFDY